MASQIQSRRWFPGRYNCFSYDLWAKDKYGRMSQLNQRSAALIFDRSHLDRRRWAPGEWALWRNIRAAVRKRRSLRISGFRIRLKCYRLNTAVKAGNLTISF